MIPYGTPSLRGDAPVTSRRCTKRKAAAQGRYNSSHGALHPTAHLRAIRKGDRIFYYHTGKEKAVVAVARALGDAYPDPSDGSGKLFVVDLAPDEALAHPVPLSAIKADGSFASFPLVRLPRLSVMPVSDAEWKRIMAMSRPGRS
ncbi:MAG: hypothetical protein A3F70_10650 [Acidobacteria bacterium RIFCSPLOWO2_12_FULL_67_14]|nr:MAG: hypothetical protein A3H29_09575 [Acidobacteria bacterium RIFCSPLOWO2_02_FULL_67_21]OFW35160.1 MAG: hypothetical protein A3F70_10650 [Acidobacteria bacterium RIFCSPLOWO2_12_FULL_67_14]